MYTKDQAEYVDTSKSNKCKNCSYFGLHPPDFESGACDIVKGIIEPEGSCKYYKKKMKKSEEGLLEIVMGEDLIVKGTYKDNAQNKKLQRIGKNYGGKEDEPKPTVDKYTKDLKAEGWNRGKISREMEHHKNMSTLTGDAGHMSVYEHLSKLHKDHPDSLEEDKTEIRESAGKKRSKTMQATKKAKERVVGAAKQWMERQTALYTAEGAQKPNSKERKDLGKLMRTKAKGVITGLKDEVKDIGISVASLRKVFTGGKLEAKERSAVKKLALTMGIVVGAVIIGDVSGGAAASGAATFFKGVGLHWLEHTGITKVLHAAAFAKGEKLDDEVLQEFYENFASYVENGEIPPELWNKLKPKGVVNMDNNGDKNMDKDLDKEKINAKKGNLVRNKDKITDKKMDKKDQKVNLNLDKEDKKSTDKLTKSIINVTEYDLLKIVLGDDIEKGGLVAKKVWVKDLKKKGGGYWSTRQVGQSKEKVKKVSGNVQQGGATPEAALANTYINTAVSQSGESKYTIMAKVAMHMGYGGADPKSSIVKFINGSIKIPDDKMEKFAEYFGTTHEQFKDLAAGKTGDELVMQTGTKFSESGSQIQGLSIGNQGWNYDSVLELMSDDSFNELEKVDALLGMGMRNGYKIQEIVQSLNFESIVDYMEENGYENEELDDDGFDMGRITGVKFGKSKRDSFKWHAYTNAINEMVAGDTNLMIVGGKGGIGKSFTMEQTLGGKKEQGGWELREFDHDPESGMIANSDEYDYVVYGGKSDVPNMVRMLFEHRDKIVIFDDFDSVIKNKSGHDILKKTFASDQVKRMVSFSGDTKLKTLDDVEVPKTFQFRGKAAIITNVPLEKIKEIGGNAIASRAALIDMTMSRRELMNKLKEIYPIQTLRNSDGVVIDMAMEFRTQAYNFINKYKFALDIENIQPRTMRKLMIRMRNNHQMNEAQLKSQFGDHYKDEMELDYQNIINQ